MLDNIARSDITYLASFEAKRFAETDPRGLNLRTIAARAGHPRARVRHYGTRYQGAQVARDVLLWLDTERRQFAFDFDRNNPARVPGPGPHGGKLAGESKSPVGGDVLSPWAYL